MGEVWVVNFSGGGDERLDFTGDLGTRKIYAMKKSRFEWACKT